MTTDNEYFDIDTSRDTTKLEFQTEIETMKSMCPDVPYLEIIAEYCEKEQIDIEDVTCFLTPALRSSIRREAASLNLLKEKTVSIYDT